MSRFLSTFCIVFLFSFSTLFAQSTINSYKYILVPSQYEFQKEADQYQINSLTKFLFTKNGFTVLSSDESYPQDLALNPCIGLKGVVRNASSMLTIKVIIDLVDCHNNIVYSTTEGRSKTKDYKRGYNEAIRSAFVGIESLDYKYDGSNGAVAVAQKEVKEVVAAPKATSDVAVVSEEMKPVAKAETKPVEATIPAKVEETAVVAVPVVVAPTKQKEVEKKPKHAKNHSIEGTYLIDVWGTCTVSKKEENYKVVGGDEDFEFAIIYKTSKPTTFMIKKVGFSQTHLLELNEDGNLQMDSNEGVKIYKRLD